MDQLAQQIGQFIGLVLLAIFATIVANGGVLLSVMRQRKAVSLATTKIDETAARQETANELLRKTFTDTIDLKNSVIDEYRREVTGLKTDVANYKEALDTTLREVDIMRAEQRQAQAEYDQRLRAMQGAIDSLTKESAQKDKELDALTKAVRAREDSIGDYAQRVNRLERALADKDSALVEAQTLIGTLKDTQRINDQRTADELQQLRERVRTLEQKVERLTAERDTFLAERDTFRAERDTARRELETLRAEYTTKATENAALLQRIEALEAKLRELTAARGEAQPLGERNV